MIKFYRYWIESNVIFFLYNFIGFLIFYYNLYDYVYVIGMGGKEVVKLIVKCFWKIDLYYFIWFDGLYIEMGVCGSCCCFSCLFYLFVY